MWNLTPSRRRSRGNLAPEPFSNMENMMRRMWEGFPFRELREDLDITWSPRLDVSETDKTVEIEADLPGMKKEDIKVSMENNILTIQGERKEEEKKEDKQYHYVERTTGSFYRSFQVPAEIDEDKIEATFKDGVLHLSLPKTEEAKKKVSNIQIK
ncbi:MAG: Hsp20/alpha crystallin family protein [Thermodesulfobacteriota bacterium]